MLKLRSFQHVYHNGIFFPFKFFIPAKVTIRKGALISLRSRIAIGNPDHKSAIVSRHPANLYFGYDSKAFFGRSVSIGPGVNIIVKNSANLFIGDNTYFTSDMHIEAINQIHIGNECAISWGVTIIDGDHHKVLSSTHEYKKNNSVQIGNHVWVGCNVTILKSTQIGDNCIIGAGSVVKGKFPSNCLIAGNPAKIVRENVNWE